MGVKKSQITKITLYESSCVIFGATIIGIIIGLIAAVAITAFFFMITELPFNLIVIFQL